MIKNPCIELAGEMAAARQAELSTHATTADLAIVLTNPTDKAAISYGLCALNGNTPGDVQTTVFAPTGRDEVTPFRSVDDLRAAARNNDLYTPDTDEASIQLVHELSRNPEYHGVMPFLPAVSHVGDAAIRLAIDPYRDVDNVSGAAPFMPATPLAMARVADHVLRSQGRPEGLCGMNPEHIGVSGVGKVVTIPLMDQVLPHYGVAGKPAVIHGDKDAILGRPHEFGAAGTKVVFTASRGAEYIKPEHVPHGAVVIDVGYADNERGATGNLHPSMFEDPARAKGIVATPFRGGVGRVTVEVVRNHTAANAIQAAQLITA